MDQIFSLPTPASESTDAGKKKRVISHKLLTDDIYHEKEDKKAGKEELEKEK